MTPLFPIIFNDKVNYLLCYLWIIFNNR